MKIIHIADFLATQLYAAKNGIPLPEVLCPIRNRDWVKPAGGVWTSTYTPEKEHTSDWVCWCALMRPEWIPKSGFLYRVSPRAKIVEIDSLKDLRDLIDVYPAYIHHARVYINFEALIRRGYDGIHLTERGQIATRHSKPYGLYGWDCESTLWFNSDHLELAGEIPLLKESVKQGCDAS